MTRATVRDLVGVSCPACHQPDTAHRSSRQDGLTRILCPDGTVYAEGDWSAKSCPVPDPMAWADKRTRDLVRHSTADHRPFMRSALARIPDPSPWLKEIPPQHAATIRRLEALYDRSARDWRKTQGQPGRWYAERRRELIAAGHTFEEASAAYPW